MTSQKLAPSKAEGSILKNLKVALVHDFLMQWGGAEQVLKQFTNIFSQADIYTICSNPKIVKENFADKRVINSFIHKFPFIKKLYKSYLFLMPKAIESFKLNNYDLVLSDSSAFAKGVITHGKTLHICYLHTPTRYLWDIPDFYINTSVPTLLRPLVRLFLPSLKEWDLSASKRPDKLIVISKTIWERTQKFYQRTPDAIIHPFFDDEKYTSADKSSQDYYLLAGRLVPYKRYDIVIDAFNQLKLPLHVVGTGYGEKELIKRNINARTNFLGFISDKELIVQYSQCKAYIFPSLEDFGITPIEAQALGRPVIAYARGGCKETVVNKKTGIFFDKQTPQAVVKAVNDFEKFSFNPHKIRKHALKFSKKRFTNEIVEFINKSIKESQYGT